jgi:transposase
MNQVSVLSASFVVPRGAGQTNRLRALLRDGEDTDHRLARARFTDAVLVSLARRRLPAHVSRQQALRRGEIRRLALALRQVARALATNRAELAGIVHDLAPGLLSQPGIGPVSAAQAIVSFSHAGRCRSDAAFAKLAGTDPIEASSGQTTRHRINRGGDRALNKALHVIAITRMRDDPATHAYLARRRTEGKSDREIRRCLIGELSAARLADRVVISSVVPGDGLAAMPRRWASLSTATPGTPRP